jgi:hypothetical protein
VGVYGVTVMVIVSKLYCHVLCNGSVYTVQYVALITYSSVTVPSSKCIWFTCSHEQEASAHTHMYIDVVSLSEVLFVTRETGVKNVIVQYTAEHVCVCVCMYVAEVHLA